MHPPTVIITIIIFSFLKFTHAVMFIQYVRCLPIRKNYKGGVWSSWLTN